MTPNVLDYLTPDEVHQLVLTLVGQLGGRVEFTERHIEAAKSLEPELLIHRFDEMPTRFVVEVRPTERTDQ